MKTCIKTVFFGATYWVASSVSVFAQTQAVDVAIPMTTSPQANMAVGERTPQQIARSLFLEGRAFHDGEGRAQDFTQARLLYRKASNLGNNAARLNLGYMAFVGQGAEQNYNEARYWYDMAARNGDSDAQQNLAMLNQRGLGHGAYKGPKPLPPEIVPAEITLTEKLLPTTVVSSLPVGTTPPAVPAAEEIMVEETMVVVTSEALIESAKTNPYAWEDLFALSPSQISALPQSEFQYQAKNETRIQSQIVNLAAVPVSKPVIVSEPIIIAASPNPELEKEAIKPLRDTNGSGSLWSRMKLRFGTKPAVAETQKLEVSERATGLAGAPSEPQNEALDPALIEPVLPVVATIETLPLDEALQARRNTVMIAGGLLFVMLSALLWFSLKFKGLVFARSKRQFFREFYKDNRAVLRETYLRYPENERSAHDTEQSWSVLLSVMVVRFAKKQAESGEKLTDYAQYILSGIDEDKGEGRKRAYALVPTLDKQVRKDCRAFTQDFLTQSSELDVVEANGFWNFSKA